MRQRFIFWLEAPLLNLSLLSVKLYHRYRIMIMGNFSCLETCYGVACNRLANQFFCRLLERPFYAAWGWGGRKLGLGFCKEFGISFILSFEMLARFFRHVSFPVLWILLSESLIFQLILLMVSTVNLTRNCGLLILKISVRSFVGKLLKTHINFMLLLHIN